MDIFFFFDVYKETASKQVNEDEEQQLKAYKQLFSVLINLDPPVEIDRLWSVSKNKTAREQLFTKWIINKVKGDQFDNSLFLGGLHKKRRSVF